MAKKNQTKTDTKKKKRLPLGEGLNLTESDLDELSKITPDDIQKTKTAWRRNTRAKYKNLLDAEKNKKPK